jgi:hypothetical protein
MATIACFINRQGKKASKIIDELQAHGQQFFEEEKNN